MAGNMQTNIGTNGRVVYVSTVYSEKPLMKGDKLYTTPPAAQRQWVKLTPEDIKIAIDESGLESHEYGHETIQLIYAIEAKLKEKNNGGYQPRESP
jgi:hypothetical protein